MAVELHQQSVNSSDVSFDLALSGGSLTPGAGTIYYTLDGTDPRAQGGQPSSTAVLYDGVPFQLPGSRTLTARALDGGQWSPVRQARFLLDPPADADTLRITEINYHPHDALPQFGEADVSADEFEFVELMNIANETIDLTDVQFVQVPVEGSDEGIVFRFATQTLEPGERIVVVKNRAAFASRYGTEIRIAEAADAALGTGTFAGSLRNAGERLTLVDATDVTIQQFDYDDTGNWPGRADGGGSSLEVVDVLGDYARASNYRNSNEFGGSPGQAGTGAVGSVVINELLTHTDLPQIDAIELFNPTGQAIPIANWYVSDGSDDYFRYRIAANQPTLAAGGYLVLDEIQLGFGFRGESSDDAWLIEADAAGHPVRFADHVEFGAAQNGVSLGRWPNGQGDLFPMETVTFGFANSGPLVPAIVVSEVHYAPQEAGEADPLTTSEREFVELWNPSAASQDVDHWRLDRAADFAFPPGTRLAPGERVVVVAFDPVAQPAKAAAFRTLYGMDTNARIFGPFDGVLDNAGERLELERPEDVMQLGLGYVLVDRVDYAPTSPWPDVSENGQSLNRQAADAYGDFPASWVAATPSPGRGESVSIPGDFNGDGQVDISDVNLLCLAVRGQGSDSRFDLNRDSVIGFDDMEFLIRDILRTSFGDADLNGVFDSSDLIIVFQAGEYEDGVVGNSTWQTGDWNCDGEFDTGDLVLAFQDGGYSAAARPVPLDLIAAVEAVFGNNTEAQRSRRNRTW